MFLILLKEIRLPKARWFRREPFLVGTIVTGASSGAIDVKTLPVRGVKKGHPAVFDPPAILLEVEDPIGHVSGELMLVDSDRDFRLVGERLSQARDAIARGSRLASLLMSGAMVEVAAVRAALKPAVDVIEMRLRNSDDDVMGRFDVMLDADDGYRAGEVITLASTRCEVDIEVNYHTFKKPIDYDLPDHVTVEAYGCGLILIDDRDNDGNTYYAGDQPQLNGTRLNWVTNPSAIHRSDAFHTASEAVAAFLDDERNRAASEALRIY